jgi:hypothetical protein
VIDLENDTVFVQNSVKKKNHRVRLNITTSERSSRQAYMNGGHTPLTILTCMGSKSSTPFRIKHRGGPYIGSQTFGTPAPIVPTSMSIDFNRLKCWPLRFKQMSITYSRK